MKILMVCLGNICRSPMAEGVLRQLAQQEEIDLAVDSAGTANYHVGEAPDRRARATMKRHGTSIDHLRGRQVASGDFHQFDLLLAMDEDNLEDLLSLAPDERLARKARLILDYAPEIDPRSVPDPYYGGDEGFEEVYRLLRIACSQLIHELKSRG